MPALERLSASPVAIKSGLRATAQPQPVRGGARNRYAGGRDVRACCPMTSRPRRWAYALCIGLLFVLGPAVAQLRGHGGPVRVLSISQDGATAISGSFDGRAILWDLRNDVAAQVLRFHDGAVNAVALLTDGRAVTIGEDARIAVWTPGRATPDRVFTGHAGPVAALAVSPGGGAIASASWDRTIRLWPLAGGGLTELHGHVQNVNGVAFLPDDKAIASASYDATVRIWPLPQPAAPIVVELPAPLNAIAAASDGEIIVAGADGPRLFPVSDRRPTWADRSPADANRCACLIARRFANRGGKHQWRNSDSCGQQA